MRLANIKKTIYYLQRNGLRSTWYAVRERLEEQKRPPYEYMTPSRAELDRQRAAVLEEYGRGCYDGIAFSIVVPAYRTAPQFLRELVESLKMQSYPFWELILADATEDDSVLETLRGITDYESIDTNVDTDISTGLEAGIDTGSIHASADSRRAEKQPKKRSCISGVVRYLHLDSNAGISENTNKALSYVQKEYIGLLDHDDLLTPDALYEMAQAIRSEREQGREVQFAYSDEDKCNGDATEFFEPHRKEKFNYDLILSNNYICHFLVMKTELMQELRFRREYDGAQDYDLVLRATAELGIPGNPAGEQSICHVPKVLYHWRCHAASTAENPRSKDYAYEAGRRALQDHIGRCGIPGRAVSLRHMGFYQVEYPGELFAARRDLGAVGGPVFARGKICGGRMDAEGRIYYENLPRHFSGYFHRAVLTQDAEAVDIRCMTLRGELHALFREVTGVSYQSRPGETRFDADALPEGTDYKALSLKLCRAIREKGYRILYRRE